MGNETLQNDISGMLDNLLGRRYCAGPETGRESAPAWLPDVDVKETKDDFVLQAALPGVRKEDVETEIKDGMLAISGRRQVAAEDTGDWLRREIPAGQFHRSFKLGARVKSEAVTAVLRDGLLEIRIPKADEAKPSKIRID